MRKIIYHIATSIDGFIEDKEGSVSGFLMEGKHAEEFVESLSGYDTVIMGKRTYEFGFQYGLKPGDAPYKGMKNIVISKSLSFESNDEIELITSNELGNIEQLKKQEGKNIWLCGGGTLAGSLLKNQLIDEIILKVNPILLGDGLKLFENYTHLLNCDLCRSKVYENGVILQHYRVK